MNLACSTTGHVFWEDEIRWQLMLRERTSEPPIVDIREREKIPALESHQATSRPLLDWGIPRTRWRAGTEERRTPELNSQTCGVVGQIEKHKDKRAPTKKHWAHNKKGKEKTIKTEHNLFFYFFYFLFSFDLAHRLLFFISLLKGKCCIVLVDDQQYSSCKLKSVWVCSMLMFHPGLHECYLRASDTGPNWNWK